MQKLATAQIRKIRIGYILKSADIRTLFYGRNSDALNLIIHMKLHVNGKNWKKGEKDREMKKEGTRVRWGNQPTKKV